MKRLKLKKLSKVVDADFLAAQSEYRRIVSEENRLRTMLQNLDEQEQAGRQLIDADPTLKTIGGDFPWHRWVCKTRERLNTELAMVLAQKGRIQENFQEKGGRAAVLDRLRQSIQKQERRKQRLDEFQKLETFFVISKRSR